MYLAVPARTFSYRPYFPIPIPQTIIAHADGVNFAALWDASLARIIIVHEIPYGICA